MLGFVPQPNLQLNCVPLRLRPRHRGCRGRASESKLFPRPIFAVKDNLVISSLSSVLRAFSGLIL